MSQDAAAAHSTIVETGYVQHRLGRLGALMASVILFIQLVQALLGDSGVGQLRQPSDWFAVSSGLCWGALWLLCKFVPMRARVLRIVEGLCLGGAFTATAFVAWLTPVEMFAALDGPETGNDIARSVWLFSTQRLSSLSVLIAMALAMTARAALVPTSPRHTATLTGGLGGPLILVWVIDAGGSSVSAAAGAPVYYQSLGAGAVVATVAAIWWVITTAVCYVIARVVHGLRVELLAARRLGQYTLVRKIGEGGMGEVYLARHSRLRRPTAVKLLPASRSSEEAVARFENEVQSTAELTHPNTITIFDYGRTEDGVFYYAMEHLHGADLGQVIEADGPQPPARVIKILQQAAGALQEAHAAGLIHRDIKPANIMLSRQGVDPDAVKVLDFGLVRPIDRGAGSDLSREGNLVGTPLYMAPEAIASPDSAGPASDIYALGAVGYFLLTATHVFSGENVVEVCVHHLHTAPDTITERLGRTVAPDLEALIMRCLAKAPSDRPQGAGELIAALERCRDFDAWTAEDAEAWWSRTRSALAAVRSSDTPGADSRPDRTFTAAAR